MGETSDDPSICNQKHPWTKRFLNGTNNNDPATSVDPNTSAAGTADTPDISAQSSLEKTTLHQPTNVNHSIQNGGGNESSALPEQPRNESEKAATQGSAVTAGDIQPKRTLSYRLKASIKRFGWHTKDALFHSYINVLLIFVPIGIAVKCAGLSPDLVFALNAVAIIPLAGLLVYATESVARRLGDTLGALLNVSFGNAVELIIYIIALSKNEIRIVQASLLGSILSNLLLILGMAFLLGGLRFREQVYNNTVTQMSACLLSLSVISLLLPTAFYASFSDTTLADNSTLKISRATSIVLLIIYVLYLLFQLKSHSYLYVSTPQHIIDEESHPGILADVLDSSSSSDSSDTASSDTDTSGSMNTTKRIRRALRRRRRKSSASSVHTATTVPSIISRGSFENAPAYNDHPTLTFSVPSRRPSTMGGIASGDEADNEHGGRPRIRDFVDSVSNHEVFVDRKSEGKKKRSKRRHKHHLETSVPEENKSIQVPATNSNEQEPEMSEPHPLNTEDGQREYAKRGLSFRQFQAPSLRPNLSKMLTQNVFVTAPTSDAAQQPPAPAAVPASAVPTRMGAYAIRRTNSLPDRLNKQNQAAQQAPAEATPAPATGPTVTFEEALPVVEEEYMSRTASAVLLLISTGLVAVCAEFMVDAIPDMLENSAVSQEFIGLIILPIVSNAAEHFTAVTVAAKNKMDLAIGVSVGSSIQISLFVTPFIVLLGWCLSKDMSLYFSLFETICLFVTVFVVNFLVLDGRSNYLEGSLLMAAYTIIAVCAFYYPATGDQSTISSGS